MLYLLLREDRIQEEKNAVLLEPLMYAVVKDHLTGSSPLAASRVLGVVAPFFPLLHSLWSKMSNSCVRGQTRNELGPQLLQVGPYEELLRVADKWVLEKDLGRRLMPVRVSARACAGGLALARACANKTAALSGGFLGVTVQGRRPQGGV